MSSPNSNPLTGPITNGVTPTTTDANVNGTTPHASVNTDELSPAAMLLWVHELQRQNDVLATDLKRAYKRINSAHEDVYRMRDCIDELNIVATSLVMHQNGRTTREYFEAVDEFHLWQFTLPVPRPDSRWSDLRNVNVFFAGLDDEDERSTFYHDGPWTWDSLRKHFDAASDDGVVV
jgi:hypothetical protein